MLHELPKKALRNLFGGNISTTQVLQTIASGMADCGVDVLVDPRITVPMADSKHKKIYLPSQVRSERALLVVSWYLDHESAHIIYTPDLRPTIDRWIKEGPVYDVCVAEGYDGVPMPLLKAVKGVLNITEDSRIEHLLSQRLPGCKRHFLNGPVAAGIEDLVEDVYEKAKEIEKEQGKDHTPLSPFWVAEMHAYALLDGWHGQKSKQYVRELLPEHVHWVMDIIDDEFGDIKDVTTTTFDSLVDRTETAMAKIIKKVLEDANEVEGGGGGQQQEQQENPFQDEFTKSKSQGEGEGEDDEEGGEGEQEDPQSGEGSKEWGDEEDETSESDGSQDEDSDSGESSGESGGASEDEGEDNEDESDEGSGGSESGEQDESEGDSGSSSSDESDDSGSDGSESGDEGEDSDDDSEEQSGGGASDGSEDSEGDDRDDAGESDSGSGDVDDESEDEDDSDEDDDWATGESGGSGDSENSSENEDDSDDEEEGPSDHAEAEEEESQLEEGDGKPKQLPKQVEEWAEDAEVDMADLIRQGHEHELAQEAGEAGSDERPKAGGSPNVPHGASSENMPEAYYDNLAPGLRTVVIDGVHMNGFVDEHQSDIFAAYDQFVRELMPPNLGPAARKLVGKFKGAPGPAYAGNRVNPRLLAPIQAGKAGGRPLMLRRNDTVYSRKGVSVMLLLDCSGSMCEGMRGLDLKEPAAIQNIKENIGYSWRDFASKFVISHASIRSLARVFQSSGVPFAVGGFTTMAAKHRNGSGMSGVNSRGFDIVNLMFKDFHEPWASSEQKMIAMNPFTQVNFRGDMICSHANSDGESLLWAATRLLQREEDIKVLIVASDGLPANGGNGVLGTAFLKYVVNRIELADVHVGALGIGCTGVQHYYRIHELIDEFPVGRGTAETAPLFVQDKVIRLVDRLMTEGGNPNVSR